MRNFTIFMAVNILGAVGWWIGSRFGMVAAFALSAAGSLAGVWVGWHLFEEYLN